jgi:hypothetical protein
MEIFCTSIQLQSVVPSRPLSCGTNAVFVGIILPMVIALSPLREVSDAEVPVAVMWESMAQVSAALAVASRSEDMLLIYIFLTTR